jgi:hypothetical protein
MSTEAQVAMLALRLLIDRPKELQKVLDYLQKEVLLRKAILEVGNKKVATREEIMQQFEEEYGLTIDFDEHESVPAPGTLLPNEISIQMRGLPEGAGFKIR